MKSYFLVILALFTSRTLAADSLTLVTDGQAKVQIVTGDPAPETVRFAAKELQTFVAKMSGAELPIAARPVAGVPAIRLGPAAREVLSAEDLNGIRRDGYLITLSGGDLCIVGLDDAGPHTDIEALLARRRDAPHARLGLPPRHALRRLPACWKRWACGGSCRASSASACRTSKTLVFSGDDPGEPALHQPHGRLLVAVGRRLLQQGLREADRHARRARRDRLHAGREPHVGTADARGHVPDPLEPLSHRHALGGTLRPGAPRVFRPLPGRLALQRRPSRRRPLVLHRARRGPRVGGRHSGLPRRPSRPSPAAFPESTRSPRSR